jgi:hypothetical protein
MGIDVIHKKCIPEDRIYREYQKSSDQAAILAGLNEHIDAKVSQLEEQKKRKSEKEDRKKEKTKK